MLTFTSADGLRIAYQDWAADDDGRPPVLLHHGFATDSTGNWVDTGLVDALRATGRRVVALDARGHGASDKPHHAAWYGETRMAEDVGRLIEVIGGGPVDLVGYSMGAIVALIAAANRTDIRRLVIGGVGAGIVEVGGMDTRAVGATVLAEALRARRAKDVKDKVARFFREFAEKQGMDLLALAAQAEAIHAAPIAVGGISAATLVLAGTEDPLAERPEVLSGLIPGARLQLVPGHHLSAVVTPQFRDALVGFLSEQPANSLS